MLFPHQYEEVKFDQYLPYLDKEIPVALQISVSPFAQLMEPQECHEKFTEMNVTTGRLSGLPETGYNRLLHEITGRLAGQFVKGTDADRQNRLADIRSRICLTGIVASYSKDQWDITEAGEMIFREYWELTLRFDLDDYTEVIAELDTKTLAINNAYFEAM